MKRTYAVNYKNKRKLLTTPEAIAEVKELILGNELIKSVDLLDDGQIVTVEVEKEEDFANAMNSVVNVFRKIDDKSEVSYKFGLNRVN